MLLKELSIALDIFGLLDPKKLPLHHVHIFTIIANQESCTYKDIQNKCYLSHAAVSRVCNALSDNARHREKSLGLIEIFIDPDEGRRYRVKLSEKGKAIIKVIENI